MKPEAPFFALADALSRGRLSLAEIAGIPPPELDAVFELAAEYLDLGREAEASSLLRALVALFPFSARFWRALGVSHHRLGQLERALSAYDTALVLEPQHSWTRCYRAEILIYLGDQKSANAELESLISETTGEIQQRSRALRSEAGPIEGYTRAAAATTTSPEAEVSNSEREQFTLGRATLPLPHEDDTTEASPLDEETTQTAVEFVDPARSIQLPSSMDERSVTALLPGRRGRARANAVPQQTVRHGVAAEDDQEVTMPAPGVEEWMSASLGAETTHTAVARRRLRCGERRKDKGRHG